MSEGETPEQKERREREARVEAALKSEKMKPSEDPDRPLSNRQEEFCKEYLKSSNGRQAAIAVGYSENGAEVTASGLLRQANVAKRIKELRDRMARPSIATGQEVMEFFTKVMNGEVKDQFGLEASLSDRTKAAIELARRTVDLDQKLAGKPDTTVEIKLDWKRD